MTSDFSLENLIRQLQSANELYQRLIHVKWSREALDVLALTLENILVLIQGQPAYAHFEELIKDVMVLLKRCLDTHQLPQGADRARLLGVLRTLSNTVQTPTPTTGEVVPSGKPPTRGLVLLLAGDDARELSLRLGEHGFRVGHLNTADELRKQIDSGLSRAVIVDMDFPQGALFAGMHILNKASKRLLAPIIFLSERSDMAARLEAVSAGGSSFFTKPVDPAALIAAIQAHWLQPEGRDCRVLLIADQPALAQKINAVLASCGIVSHVVAEPLKTLWWIQRLEPDAVLLDLELGSVEGLDLLKVLRHDSGFANLPVIALSGQTDANKQSTVLEAGGNHLVNKNALPSQLVPIITHDLRRHWTLCSQFIPPQQRDPVSTLYHRGYFLQQVQQVLQNKAEPVSLLILNMDNLRAVEARDMMAADAVVAEAAERLRAALGTGQRAARFGDASFAVLSTVVNHDALLADARRLRAALETGPYAVGEVLFQLHTSVGISIGAEDRDYRMLLQQAVQAASSAWVGGGEHIAIYDPATESSRQASQEARLVDEIRAALEQQRLRLVFQPIVSVSGEIKERYEVWLRLRNQEGLELLPASVFAATQKHRLGIALDRWVIFGSLRMLQERHTLQRETTLFINISPALLHDKKFVPWLQTALEETGVNARELVFEMAEATAQQNYQALRHFLNQIKSLGCGFSLDGFGNGEHSRALVRGLGANYVKIGAPFSTGLAKSSEKQQHFRALAQQLGELQVTVIASHIEDLPTLCALSACGIHYAQGFLLQRPQEEMSYNFTGGTPQEPLSSLSQPL